MPMPLLEVPDVSWIASEGHLPRVWLLAETAAAAMGADQVRIDIFIRKGDPSALVIRDISSQWGSAPLPC